MAIRRLEIDNVEAVLKKDITKDGKVSGLTKWAGKKAVVVIQNEDIK